LKIDPVYKQQKDFRQMIEEEEKIAPVEKAMQQI
jgi:hypothetical protein